MSYIKASDILPEEIVELIQNYIDGEYIYIPRKEGGRKVWGTSTNSRKETFLRNSDIYDKYKAGISIEVLSEMYYLSPKSIQRIVLKMKREKR